MWGELPKTTMNDVTASATVGRLSGMIPALFARKLRRARRQYQIARTLRLYSFAADKQTKNAVPRIWLSRLVAFKTYCLKLIWLTVIEPVAAGRPIHALGALP
jgi:hypothetical protein